MIYQGPSSIDQIGKLIKIKKKLKKASKSINTNEIHQTSLRTNKDEMPRGSLKSNEIRASLKLNPSETLRGSLKLNPSETLRSSLKPNEKLKKSNEIPRGSLKSNTNEMPRGSSKSNTNETPRGSLKSNTSEMPRGSLKSNETPRRSLKTKLNKTLKDSLKSNTNDGTKLHQGSIVNFPPTASIDEKSVSKSSIKTVKSNQQFNDMNKSKKYRSASTVSDKKVKNKLLNLFHSMVSKNNPQRNESIKNNPQRNESIVSTNIQTPIEEPSNNDLDVLQRKKSKRKINKLTVSNNYSRTVDITPFFVYLLTLHLNQSSQETQNVDGNLSQCCQTTNVLLKKIVEKLGQVEQSKNEKCNDNLKENCCKCGTKGSELEAKTNINADTNAPKTCLCNNSNRNENVQPNYFGYGQGNYQYNQNMASDCFARFDQKYSDLYARINALLTPQRDFVVYDMHIPDYNINLQNQNWPSQIQSGHELKNYNKLANNSCKFKIPQPIFAPTVRDSSNENLFIEQSKKRTKENNVEIKFPTSKSQKETSDQINKEQIRNIVDEPLIQMMDNIIKQCLLQDSLREKLGKHFKEPLIGSNTARFNDTHTTSRSITDLSQTDNLKPIQSRSIKELANESRKPSQQVNYRESESNYDQIRKMFTNNKNSIPIYDMVYEGNEERPKILRDNCFNRMNYEKTRDEIEILRNCNERRLDHVFENLLEKRFNKNTNKYHSFHFRKSLDSLCNAIPVKDDNIPTVIQNCINNYYYRKGDSNLFVEPPIILKNYKDFNVENDYDKFNRNVAKQTQTSTASIPVLQEKTEFELDKTESSRLSLILSPKGQSLTKIDSSNNELSGNRRFSKSEQRKNSKDNSSNLSPLLSPKRTSLKVEPIEPIASTFKPKTILKYEEPNELSGKRRFSESEQSTISKDSSRLSVLLSPDNPSLKERPSEPIASTFKPKTILQYEESNELSGNRRFSESEQSTISKDSSRLSVLLSPNNPSLKERPTEHIASTLKPNPNLKYLEPSESPDKRRFSSPDHSINSKDDSTRLSPPRSPNDPSSNDWYPIDSKPETSSGNPLLRNTAKTKDAQKKKPSSVFSRIFGKKGSNTKPTQGSDDSNSNLDSNKRKRKKRQVKRLPVGAPASQPYIRPKLDLNRLK